MAKIESCPNKSSLDYKRLEKKFGEFHAYELFMKNGGRLPSLNFFDNQRFTEKSILDHFTFRDSNELINYLDNSEGITSKNGEYFVAKDNSTKQHRKFGLHKVKKLNELYPGLLSIQDLGRGEKSPQNTLKITVNKKVLDNPTLFKEENTKEAQDAKLNDVLIGFLSPLGISVEDYNNWRKAKDIDAVAVSDMVNKVIYVAQDKADATTLPEEVAHFALEMLKDGPIASRIYNILKTNDYYREVLGEDYSSYNEIYNGDIDLLVKEAAGKLLGKAIINNFNNERINTKPTILNLIKRLFNNFLNIFKKADINVLHQKLKPLLDSVAADVLEHNLDQFEVDNLTEDVELFQISNRGIKRIEDVATKTLNKIAKRIQALEAKDKKVPAAKDKILLRRLSGLLDDSKYILGAVKVVKSSRDTFNSLNKRIKEVKDLLGDINNIDIRNTAKTLRDVKGFTNSYVPMLEEIGSELEIVSLEELDDREKRVVNNLKRANADMLSKAKALEKIYIDLSIPLFAKALRPYVGDGPLKDIESALRSSDKDISVAQRYIDAMADSNNDILKLIDVLVKDTKQASQQKALDIQKDLLQAKIDAEKAGVKTTEFVMERDSKGKLTGNIVTKFNQGQYRQDFEEFTNSLNKKYGVSNDYTKRSKQLGENANLYKDYNKDLRAWFEENTQPNPEAKEIIEKQRKVLKKSEFDEWYQDNVGVDFLGEEYYKKDLVSPSDKYLNKQYTEIQNSPAKLKLYNIIKKNKDELDLLLPRNRRLGFLLPQMKKDFVNRLKNVKELKDLKGFAEEFKDSFVLAEDDTQFGSQFRITDEAGRQVKFLPIHFTSRLSNTDNLSTDIIESMSAFAAMAQEYQSMNKIIDVLEIGKDVVNVMDVGKVDDNGNPVYENGIEEFGKKFFGKLKKPGDRVFLKQRLEDYYDMVVYGMTSVEGATVKVLGENVQTEKVLDLIGKYTAINALALNVYAGLQNPIVGKVMLKTEALAKEHFDNKDLRKAEAKYSKELPKALAQMENRNPNSWLALWLEKFDVMRDFNERTRNLNTERKTWFGRMFNISSLFFINRAGEHYIQSVLSLSLANRVKLKDSSGKEITLHDAYEVKGNKLVLKEGVTKLDGSAWTDADERAFMRKTGSINNSLNGIYNDIDKSALQKYALGRLVLMFRKFIRPGVNRRFRKINYNYLTQSDTEGYYRTTARFIAQLGKDIKEGQFSLAKNWDKLSTMEKANLMRSVAEAAHVLAAMVLGAILTSFDLDDDDWEANMIAYQAKRLVTELSFYINPVEMLRIFQSPAPALNQLEKVTSFIGTLGQPWNWGEELTRGKYKGYSKIHRQSLEVIPLYATLTDITTPEEKLRFFVR